MADIFPGDGALENYINKNSDGSFPKELAIILMALKEKMTYLTKIYGLSMESYLKLDSKDPLKELLKNHIIKISDYSIQAIDQFDYILMCDNEDDDEKTGPGLESGESENL
jgi:hypothetical protein